MKNLFKLGVCLVAVMFMMAFKSYRAKIINPIIELPVKGIVSIPTEPLMVDKIELAVSSHQAFLDAIGFRESGNRYDIVNRYGYMGLLKQNKRSLRKYIAKYDGKYIHGVLVTESGLLAAAHLGGAGSVKKWFRTGKVRKDGNGVKITSYMERFGGYDLNV